MTTNRSLLLILLLLPLLLLVALRLPAQPPSPGTRPVGIQPQKQTVQDIRNVGTAMWAWLADQRGTQPAKMSEEANSAAQKKPVPTSAPFGDVPVISHEELTRLLVPRYIPSIPERDGWGHPYEYRMNVENPRAEHAIALRSPGLDGRFSAVTYDIGGYFHDEVSQDVAWMDGYFVRWPTAEVAAK